MPKHLSTDMARSKDMIHQANADDVHPEGYACYDCGFPFESTYDSCPKCDGTDIRLIEEVMDKK